MILNFFESEIQQPIVSSILLQNYLLYKFARNLPGEDALLSHSPVSRICLVNVISNKGMDPLGLN